MRLSPERIVLVGVLLAAILLELFLVFAPRLNLLADAYRHAERQKVLGDWGQQRTPESKAVWDHEREMLDHHLHWMALVMIAAAVVEGMVLAVVVHRGILTRSHDDAA